MQYITDPSGFLTTTGELAYSETDDSMISAFIISVTCLSTSFFRAYDTGYAVHLKGLSSVSSILHSARLVFPGMSVKTSLYSYSDCLTSLCWSSLIYLLILTYSHVSVALMVHYLISSLLSSQVSCFFKRIVLRHSYTWFLKVSTSAKNHHSFIDSLPV